MAPQMVSPALALALVLAGSAGASPAEPGEPAEACLSSGPQVGATTSPPRDPARPAGTLLLFVGAAAFAVLGVVAARPDRRDVVLAATIGACGVVLRFALGAWGPFHVNGQGPLWIASAIGGRIRLSPAYGPGYAELLGPIARAFPAAPDTAVFAAVALASASIPVVAWALARTVGGSRAAALLAAVALAIDPVAIRMAATESYLPPVAALALAATTAFAGASAMAAARRWPAAALLGLAAALLAAQAVRMHPVAWIPAALAPLGALAAPPEAPVRFRLLVTAALGALALVAVAAIDFGVLRDGLAAVGGGTLYRPRTNVPGILQVAVAVAVLIVLSRVAPRPWLLPLASAHAAVAFTTYVGFLQSAIWYQAYLRLFVPAVVVAVAANIPRLLLAPAAVAVALGVGMAGAPIVRGRTTEHHEYRWVRAALARIPPGCGVAYLWRVGERRLAALPILSPLREIDLDVAERAGDLSGGCVYWIRSSICSSVEGRPACDALEAALALERVASATFAAVPSYDDLPYDRAEVECVLSRVAGPRGAAGPAAAATIAP